jgi:hypothetical protein
MYLRPIGWIGRLMGCLAVSAMSPTFVVGCSSDAQRDRAGQGQARDSRTDSRSRQAERVRRDLEGELVGDVSFTQLMAINEAECDSAGQAKSGSLFDCTGFAEADGSAIDLGTWWVEPRSGEYARVTPGGEGNQAPAGPEEASAAYQEVVDARGDGEAFASCAPGIQIGAERITHNAYICAVVAAQGELLVMIRWNENGTVASEQIDLDSVGGTGQVPE